MIDLEGKTVLVTGGTMGIGSATGLEYGRAGAFVVLTHRWGSADLDAVRARFEAVCAPAPLILEADVARDEDTSALLDRIAETRSGVDVFVSNVALAPRVADLDEYSRRGLSRAIDYSAWPMFAYSQQINRRFGSYPKYIIGLSSDGPESFFQNYDFVAMSKSVLETMCRYMNFRLFEQGTTVNVIRSRLVRTESFDSTFGKDFHDYLRSLGGFEDCYTTPQDIAKVASALGSGLMDAVGGQVLMVDKGFRFFDNLMGIGERAKAKTPEVSADVSGPQPKRET